MKIQDYCKVTDSVRPDPALKEAIMMKAAQHSTIPAVGSTEEPRGKIQRRIGGKAVTGTAVAAALVAANVGLAAMLMHSGSSKTPQAATSGENNVQEIKLETAHYVQCMQDYYASVTGEPCTYDFTGMGQDLDYEWSSEDYKITLHAAAGDAFQMHLFYDVIPLKGQEYAYAATYADQAERMKHQDWPCVNARYTRYDGEYDPDSVYDMTHLEPLFGGLGVDPGTAYAVTNDGENGGEVWHMHCVLYETTGTGFRPTGFHVQVDEREKGVENSWIEVGSTDTQDPETNELYYLNFDFIQAPQWHDACFPIETGLSEYTHIAVTPLTIMLKDDAADSFPYQTWQKEAGQHTGDAEASQLMCSMKEMQADCKLQTVNGEITEQALDTPTRFAVKLYSDQSVSASTWYYPLGKPVSPLQCYAVILNNTQIPVNIEGVKDPQPQTADKVPNAIPNGYEELMQAYFGNDLSYTGWGEDCDLTWNFDDTAYTLDAIGGDNYHLYYFYRITIPKNAAPEDFAVALLDPDAAAEGEVPVGQQKLLAQKEDGDKIVYCYGVFANEDRFFARPYSDFALSFVPTVTKDSTHIAVQAQSQTLKASFLTHTEEAVNIAAYRYGNVPFTCRDREYVLAYTSPFGIRMIDREATITNGVLLDSTDAPDEQIFAGAKSAGDAFAPAAMKQVRLLTFGTEHDDIHMVDAVFDQPIDLPAYHEINICGQVLPGVSSWLKESDAKDDEFSGWDLYWLDVKGKRVTDGTYYYPDFSNTYFDENTQRYVGPTCQLFLKPSYHPDTEDYALNINFSVDGEIIYAFEASVLSEDTPDIPIEFTLPKDFPDGSVVTVSFVSDDGKFTGSKSITFKAGY